MNTKNNTILFLDMFDNETLNKIVIHIPHSSTVIPFYDGFNVNLLNNEITKLTDWATNKIFKVKNVTTIETNFSRIFCDVERFSNDELEPMFKYGRGFYYTHTDDGKELRLNNLDLKNKILNEYYLPHHQKLNDTINDKLEKFNEAIIIDCHSYSDVPFDSDLIKEKNRPDICIGTDNFHTPIELSNYIVKSFEDLGYIVKVNNPYSGTIVNNNSYQKDNRVKSIMIEINRKLYMSNNAIDNKKIQLLNTQIQSIIYSI
jgi:N-formylglutamate amidohydrolase